LSVRRPVLIALAFLVAVASAPAATASGPADALARLVDAQSGDDLVLRAARLMLPFALDTDDLIALKEAGASDELVVALLDLTEAVAAQTSAEITFRVSSVADGRGGRAILLTNLDHNGRHLDGRSPRGTRPNIVSSRPRPTETMTPAVEETASPGHTPPVVVVVNNNPPPESEPPPSAFVYDGFGRRAYLPTHTTNRFPVAVGGATGPVKYPVNRRFLGYEAKPAPRQHYFLGYAPDGTKR
jgi:hypothetical protein